MTTEEEEGLAQMFEDRKAKRKADIREHKRRSKFDPLAAAEKMKAMAAAADSGAAAREPPPTQAAARPSPAVPQRISGTGKAVPLAGARLDPSPRIPKEGSAQTTRPPLFSSLPAGVERHSDDDDDDDDEIDEAEFEAAALAFLREEEEEKESIKAVDEPPDRKSVV